MRSGCEATTKASTPPWSNAEVSEEQTARILRSTGISFFVSIRRRLKKFVGLDGLPWRNCTTTEESTTKRSTCSTSLRRSAKEPRSSAGLACGARKTSASSLVKRLAADLYVVLEKVEVIVVTEEADKVNDDERDAAKLGKAFLLHSAMPKL